MAAKKKTVSKAKLIAGAGAGIAAAAAIAAGAQYLYGKEGAKHRAQLKKLAGQAKSELKKEAHKLGKLNRKAFDETSKVVASRYKDLKKISAEDVAAFAKELQGHWKDVSREFETLKKKAVAQAKKAGTKPKARKPAAKKRK
jgi:hypothetical protein